MDLREFVPDWEETLRTVFAGLMAGHWHVMPGQVTEDSSENHVCSVQPTIKRVITDTVTGRRSFEDHPIHVDVPIKFASGGGVTHTFPITKGLEGILVYGNRDIDSWHQSSGSQQPVTDRMHGYADPFFIPGVRSTPRKLEQVSATSSQLRSDDGHHTVDHDPKAGTTIKSVDPSTAPASPTFSPFASATKFVEHSARAGQGVLGRAVDGSTEHSHGVDHGVGAFMRALGGLHEVLAHPDLGALLSAAGGAHTVTTSPSGVNVQSKTAVGISAPPGMLSLAGLAGGSIGGEALASGAASSNVGALSGDLAGSLPSPTVTNLSHVVGQNTALVQAASDSAAAAAGVGLGSLYVNTAVKTGVGVLAVRLA